MGAGVFGADRTGRAVYIKLWWLEKKEKTSSQAQALARSLNGCKCFRAECKWRALRRKQLEMAEGKPSSAGAKPSAVLRSMPNRRLSLQ